MPERTITPIRPINRQSATEVFKEMGRDWQGFLHNELATQESNDWSFEPLLDEVDRGTLNPYYALGWITMRGLLRSNNPEMTPISSDTYGRFNIQISMDDSMSHVRRNNKFESEQPEIRNTLDIVRASQKSMDFILKRIHFGLGMADFYTMAKLQGGDNAQSEDLDRGIEFAKALALKLRKSLQA